LKTPGIEPEPPGRRA